MAAVQCVERRESLDGWMACCDVCVDVDGGVWRCRSRALVHVLDSSKLQCRQVQVQVRVRVRVQVQN